MLINGLILPILFAFLSTAKDSSTAGCVDCDLAAQGIDLSKLGPGLEQKAFNNLEFLDPELVERMDSRKLAEMIVQRLSDRCDTLRDPSMTVPNDNDSEIIMLVPDEAIGSISKNGFKNQHQTSSTNGSACRACRLNAESGHIDLGLPYTNKMRELLPKYALQVFTNDKKGQYTVPGHYGDVMFKFKPEVKKRATWSFRDSLSIRTELRTHNIRAPKGKTCGRYCEAQIWGDLQISDVQSIYIKKGKTITDEMKALNLPIYTYERLRTNDELESKKTFEEKNSWNYGSLKAIRFSKEAIYTPTGSRTQNKPLTDSEVREQLKSANSVTSTILKNNLLSTTSTTELVLKYNEEVRIWSTSLQNEINEVKKSKAFEGSGLKITAEEFVKYKRMDTKENRIGSDRLQILAELVARRSEPEALKALKKAQAFETFSDGKYLATLGLSQLPWTEYKKYLLDVASLPDTTNGINRKLYLLAKYKNDPDIKTTYDRLIAKKREIFDSEKMDPDFDYPDCSKETYE